MTVICKLNYYQDPSIRIQDLHDLELTELQGMDLTLDLLLCLLLALLKNHNTKGQKIFFMEGSVN